MPGKLCDFQEDTNPLQKNAWAACEGFLYRATDVSANHPKTDNPHQPGSRYAKDWDAGWDHAKNLEGQTLTRADVGCCAGEGLTVPTDPP